MSALNTILSGTCPCCQKSKVFEKSTIVTLFEIPKMRDNCNNCGYKFTKEPGFFFGAMYVSYGLIVAQMLTVAVASKFILGLENLPTVLAMGITALLFSKVNFRLSRLIWMQLFLKKAECN
ncbi:DUF983 domain-containing protein [Owenweeksia hongkongensis]|uniref:DUF983 domain-containing protein n=1 Tax=Owenweeksia hongkongensis TaxID=253245 RepID=UPI003A928DF8